MISNQLPTTINTGDISVSITPPAADTLTVSTFETLAGFSIGLGTYKVTIKNVGAAVEGGAFADIVVNGQDVAPGEQLIFEAKLDPSLGANGTFLKLPAFTVTNASGAGVWYQVES